MQEEDQESTEYETPSLRELGSLADLTLGGTPQDCDDGSTCFGSGSP